MRVSIDWTLGANLENLRLHGPAIVGEGNGLHNQLAGNGNANRLYGLGGNDTLFGLTGNDRLFGGAGNDTFVWTPSVRLLGMGHRADPNPDNEPVLVDDGADLIFGEAGSDTYVVPTASFSRSPVSTWPSTTASAQTWRRKSSTTSIPASSGTGSTRSRTSGPATRPTGSSARAGANVIESGGGYNVVRAGGGDDIIIGGVTREFRSIDPARTIMELLDGGAGNDVIDSGGSYWLSIWVSKLRLRPHDRPAPRRRRR